MSNQPIYCLKSDCKYALLQAMACLSPAIIQHANINQPATKTPAPIPKNINITYLALSTIASPPFPKESVMLPHNKANAGRAAPIAKEAIVPIVIKMRSALVANRKRWKNDTFSTSSYFLISFDVRSSRLVVLS